MIGAGAGFLPPVSFNATNHAEKIAAADVNGNGILDVVVGETVDIGPAATFAVIINTGNGNFAAPVIYDAAPGGRFGSTAVALADLDNDGDVDLIGGGLYSSGSIDNGAVTIRRNNGTGTFGAAEIILFTNPNYVSIQKSLPPASSTVTVFRILLLRFLRAERSKVLSSSTAMVPAASTPRFITKRHNRHSTSLSSTSTVTVTVISLRSQTPQRRSLFIKILAMVHSQCCRDMKSRRSLMLLKVLI